ncbi:class I SAM-dependent methyltransferase [Desulfobacula phenolica]|uniref:Methyltransferase domain-containing protein n=1 Tax=Desulfobacula phenolica TaxID=90732 RepID=A0A1H2DN96_9BACT|nr:class I SAM-dependent methyltransferase [Desulfobacula phenolica]SDT84407.1 Methyltransferase domain-containing protein [Desulfobacula phenolica]
MPDKKKQDFNRKMVDILNYGALNLAMGIGYKTGLFDVMDTMGAPASVKQIAGSANLNERYVSEWLGVMVTGQIVHIVSQASGETAYSLPAEHAACLTRRAGDANLGVYSQEIPLLTQCALEQVEKGFSSGEGVPFSCYPKFQSFMAELSNAKHEQVLVDKFLPGVDNGRLVDDLERGIAVCDIGCGEGVALNLMAQHFPKSDFIGIDTHEAAIETARTTAVEQGLKNVTYLIQDAARIEGNSEFQERFDYITAFDSIHDQTKPLDALKGVRYMLSGNGRFSMVDIDAGSDHAKNLNHPMGPFLYTVSLMHCMPVGLVDGGTGLGMMWGRQKAVQMLNRAGFEKVDVIEMEHDPFNVHYFANK